MTRRNLRRGLLGASTAAAILLSPVFWLLPNKGVSVGGVRIETETAPHWAIWAQSYTEYVYDPHDPLAFDHRQVYASHYICCGALFVSVRGRQTDDLLL